MPIGSGRFELYTEPADDAAAAAPPPVGFWARTLRRLLERWHDLARAAHAPRETAASSGRLARGRDWLVRRIAESIAEQRTLWSLRRVTSALFVHPSNLSSASAAAIRERLLTHAATSPRLVADRRISSVSLVTAILVLLPGPNLIGYYFVFRAIGHFLSWRGARQALERISWTPEPEDALAELGELAQQPRAERADRVDALAARLRLPRLVAFFDRVAVPAR